MLFRALSAYDICSSAKIAFFFRWRSSIINTGVNTAICFVSWSILCTHTHISAPRSASIQVNKLVKRAYFKYFHNDKFSVDINIHTCERRAHSVIAMKLPRLICNWSCCHAFRVYLTRLRFGAAKCQSICSMPFSWISLAAFESDESVLDDEISWAELTIHFPLINSHGKPNAVEIQMPWDTHAVSAGLCDKIGEEMNENKIGVLLHVLVRW